MVELNIVNFITIGLIAMLFSMLWHWMSKRFFSEKLPG